MKNFEKYKGASERSVAFRKFCAVKKCKNCELGNSVCSINCSFAWLEFEAEEEKPLPCPFCGGTYFNIKIVGQYSPRFRVNCGCGYCGDWKKSESDAIAAHNRVAKAVADAKKEVE